MTKEERAIKILYSYLPKDEPMNVKDREAFFVAIEALKQKPILDKMKAEIKALPRYGATSSRYLTVYVDIYEVLKIINEYGGEA